MDQRHELLKELQSELLNHLGVSPNDPDYDNQAQQIWDAIKLKSKQDLEQALKRWQTMAQLES